MSENENILSSELENIFHNEPQPNKENILRNGSYESNIESSNVVDFFNDKKWTDITLKKFRKILEAFPLPKPRIVHNI